MEGGQVVMFPFLAQGHLIPFLALAKLIEQRNHCTSITLVSTPLNILKLRPSLPPNTTIHLAELPFTSSDHGLPPNSENTDTLPFHLFIPFFFATETLKPSFELLLSGLVRRHGHENICVIADMFLGWTVETAGKLGVFHSVFVTSGAYGSVVCFSLWLHPPLLPESSDENDEVSLVDFPEVRITRSQIVNTLISVDGEDSLTVFLRRQLNLCFKSGGFLVNTVEEFEKKSLSLLRRKTNGIPIWTVGPVRFPSPSFHSPERGSLMEWLHSKPPASVIYVSFGSHNTIPASQMVELAMGLEASSVPFVWVVWPPVEFSDKVEFRSEWLPEGFEQRMREGGQGLVVHRWAPQLEILSHQSTGGFLSHCGWNSVLESMSEGVPMIGWPLVSDQLHNCKIMVEEMGVCVEVARGRNSGSEGLECGWRGVESVIRLVMGGTEEGREMRRKAGKISEVLRGATSEEGGVGLMGSSLRNLGDFFQTAFPRRERKDV